LTTLPHPGAAPASPADDRLGCLERRTALHDRGALTDDEFAAEKSALQVGA
jgi:hypothetical protein